MAAVVRRRRTTRSGNRVPGLVDDSDAGSEPVRRQFDDDLRQVCAIAVTGAFTLSLSGAPRDGHLRRRHRSG
jgi:hypothetical protein